jgi:segregation and condensation protein A
VLERVLNGEAIPFRALVRRQSKGFVIATFLAVLELARQHHVHLEIAADRTDFVVTQHDDPPSNHDDPGIVGGDGTMDVAF